MIGTGQKSRGKLLPSQSVPKAFSHTLLPQIPVFHVGNRKGWKCEPLVNENWWHFRMAVTNCRPWVQFRGSHSTQPTVFRFLQTQSISVLFLLCKQRASPSLTIEKKDLTNCPYHWSTKYSWPIKRTEDKVCTYLLLQNPKGRKKNKTKILLPRVVRINTIVAHERSLNVKNS